ncbi:MAG: aspartate--ammonia ligase [Bacteroidia bacterium]|nr:aspartate--ammonia ligase [Bacteroidia bacterium]
MYCSKLNLLETEIAIKFIKDGFEKRLAKALNLTRVSAPLIVSRESGINDYLNGTETPVGFVYRGQQVEIVQSLAKWKRMALKRYGFKNNQGLYCDMNALRQDEAVDYLHSLYVDQWDWEKIILAKDRNKTFLFETVRKIYAVLRKMESSVNRRYGLLSRKLPREVYFIDSQDLEDSYPGLDARQREYAIVKKHKAVFVHRIGGLLKSKTIHDGRSPDYDDWNLNGDLLLFDNVNDGVLEVSSMGIRVDEVSLLKQLEERNALDRLQYSYHQGIIKKELPLTIGGGIGQSRICQFLLEKKHIGEVQTSYWPDSIVSALDADNVHVL